MLEDRNPLCLVLDVTSHNSAFLVARALGVSISAAVIVAEPVAQLWRFSTGFSQCEGSANTQHRPRGAAWGVLGLVFPRSPLSQRLRKPGAGTSGKGQPLAFVESFLSPVPILQPL